ncbi:MAG TPA: FmdB family zinc ribbon protein [Longimicrobiales bacterium]|nr:FmdB family zinc ribbon protein [Longimicrobiales bacterium]
MPTYEYRCENAHAFEQFQRISDPPLEVCPQCGAPAERILSGGAGLLFKGSGFYITDYRSDSYRKAAASDQGGAAGGAEGGGGKGADAAGEKSAGKGEVKGGEKSGGSGGAGPTPGASTAG